MQDTTDRAAVIVEQFMGRGYFETRDELQDVPSAEAKVDNQKTFSVVNYSKSIDISKITLMMINGAQLTELLRTWVATPADKG